MSASVDVRAAIEQALADNWIAGALEGYGFMRDGLADALVAVVVQAQADERKRIAQAIEADDDWFDPTIAHHNTINYWAGIEDMQERAAAIARADELTPTSDGADQ